MDGCCKPQDMVVLYQNYKKFPILNDKYDEKIKALESKSEKLRTMKSRIEKLFDLASKSMN